MSNAAYLLIAVGASVLGSFVLWLRYRRPRERFSSSVEEFRGEMYALGRQQPEPSGRRRRRRRRERPQPIVPAQTPPEPVRKLRDARRGVPDADNR